LDSRALAGPAALPDLPARLRLFADAYGLTDRKAILPALAGPAGRPGNAVDAALLQWFHGVWMRFARVL
jgi:hypothetical protein